MEQIIPELALVLVFLFILTRSRKYFPKSERLLKGLIVYLPPDDEKISKALANPKKFVLNCGHIDAKYSHNSPFFSDAEFLLMTGTLCGLCVTAAVFLNYFIGFTLSTSSYLTLLLLVVSVKGVYTQFKQAGFRSPDNWMGLFYSMTILSFSSMFLYLDHQTYFAFNFHFSLNYWGLTVTHTLRKVSTLSFSVNPLLFSILFSLLLSLLIFPYFRYIFRSTLNYYASKETPFDVQGVKEVSPLYRFSFLFPVLITFLWFRPVSDPFSALLTASVWAHLRVFLVICYSFLRMYQLRSEVQTLLDQGKSLIYEIIRTKNKETRTECELQCKAIGAYAWPLAHQSLSYSFFTLSLCLLLLCKAELQTPYPQPASFTASQSQPDRIDLDENEFVFDTSAVVTPSMTVNYYAEIRAMEQMIQAQKPGKEKVEVQLERFLASTLVPAVLYRDCIEYALFLYHLSTVLAIGLTLLYKRRFYSKPNAN
jgi:hypothetical protein